MSQSIYSKVLIKVPSDYINTMKNGTLLIKPPRGETIKTISTTRKSYTRKPKTNNNNENILTPTETPSEKPKLIKGSDAMREHTAKMRSMRKYNK